MQTVTPPLLFDRINIEISNVCNLKCSFCPAVERGKQVLSSENFSKILDQVAPYTKEVVLHLLGEPLGHPEFAKILDVAALHKVPVNVVTNGVLLTGDRPQLLLHPIIRQVSFSLQSFEANFPGRDPVTYIERIKAFSDRALVERPDLYVNLRFWDLASVDSAAHKTSLLRQTLAKTFEFSWSDISVDLRRRKNWKLRGRQYLHFDSRFEWPNMSRSILQDKGTCHALTRHVGIHANGVVVPCCLDHNADIPLGNIFETTFLDILKTPRARSMVEGFKKGELREELCKRCGFIERFDRKKSLRLSSSESSSH